MVQELPPVALCKSMFTVYCLSLSEASEEDHLGESSLEEEFQRKMKKELNPKRVQPVSHCGPLETPLSSGLLHGRASTGIH